MNPQFDRISEFYFTSTEIMNGVSAWPAEEATAGQTIHLRSLNDYHRELAPASYLEIGV